MMKSFFLALQFLTVIPVRFKKVSDKDIAKSMAYFPVFGLLLGLVLSGLDQLLFTLNFAQITIDIVLVISLCVFTGGMHMDGLADTSDAFLSRKNKEEMLKIMRDSHIGVMGVLSILSVILLKIAFLYSIDKSLKPVSLILMCSLSRWSLVCAMFLFPYARQEGKAKSYIQGINLKILLIATVLALASAIAFWQFKGLCVLLVIAFCTHLIGKFINNKISGITGDTLGALCELNEATVLLTILALTKIFL